MTKARVRGRGCPRWRGVASACTLAWILAIAPGCDRGESDSSGGADDVAAEGVAAELDGPMGEVVAAWGEAGLEASEFLPFDDEDEAAAEVDLGADECRAGRVEEIPVLLCAYDSAEEAEAAEETGLQLLEDTTGASLAVENLLLVVGDHHGVDPEGQRLHEITRVFRDH